MTRDDLVLLAKECRDHAAAQVLLRNVEGCSWEIPYHDGVHGDAQCVIGYAAGNEDRDVQLRLWELFETEHFGFAPNERLTPAQLLMSGYRTAKRIVEDRERFQKMLDAHDFTGLRSWVRAEIPGEPDWPDRSAQLYIETHK